MKDLVVAVIALLLGAFGPQRYQSTLFDPLWMLGLVVLVAYSCGQMARGLRLPSMVGWIAAGLILGSSGMQLALPEENRILHLVRDAAAVWIAFQIGLNAWPLVWLDWKRAGVLLASTLGIGIAVALGIALWLEPPWWLALLLGALSCLWGPFTGVPTTRRRQAVQVGTVGAAFSLVVLSAVLLLLEADGLLAPATTGFVGRLWLSLILGAVCAGFIRLLSLLPKTINGLLFGLFGVSFLFAALFDILQMHALPFGFAAGVVLAQRPAWGRRLRYLLHRVGPIPYLFYFALLAAALDVRLFWPVAVGLLPALLVAISALLLLRGVFSAIYLRFAPGRAQRDLGGHLLPRGVLLFELCYASGFGLLDALSGSHALLLRQFVLGDILVSALLYVTLARIVQYAVGRMQVRAVAKP
jgi:Kef-type K+ transport system membrane component KefB